jgi:hypothetical protein
MKDQMLNEPVRVASAIISFFLAVIAILGQVEWIDSTQMVVFTGILAALNLMIAQVFVRANVTPTIKLPPPPPVG